MSDTKELIKKRGSIKGRLTTFINYVNNIEGVLTSIQATELELRISKMDHLLEQFDEIQCSIECLTEETSGKYNDRNEFEDQYYSIVAKAKLILKRNKAKADDDDDSSSCESNVSGNSHQRSVLKPTKSRSSRGIKLPTIQVPKFSGQYDDWLEFRDTFVSLIHDNQSISNIQKFHYLRASLDGGAAQVIRSLEFSSSNYTVAWDLLCDRFDNKRLLIQNHIQSMFTMEQMKRESSQSIRKIIDTFTKNLRSLEMLGEPTKSWDTLIIYLINTKLDAKTSREWEERKGTLQNITIIEFMSFLKMKSDLLETINISSRSDKHTTDQLKSLATTTNTGQFVKCPICSGEHRVFSCDTFLSQSVSERAESVRRLRLCINCLRAGHQARFCRSRTCMKCQHKHNTLLHNETDTQQEVPALEPPPVDNTTTLSVHTTERVLLSTAVIYIHGKNNQRCEARAVLDSGSQASFITETLLNKLNLKCISTHTSVTGINNSVSQITKRCKAFIQSRVNSYKVEMSFLVLPNIANICKDSINLHKLQLPTHVVLADPEYYSPSSVDILLGADIFWELIEQGKISLGPNSPILQETKLGYVVSGPTSGLNLNHASSHSNNIITCHVIQNEQSDIQDQLSKFWSLEETPINSTPIYSNEERLCEEHFIQNFNRMPDGRFSVTIPLKKAESCLGDSFERAKQCFLSVERRLQRQSHLKQMYTEFMTEYKTLGHMTPIPITQIDDNQHSYYLPHHGVLRESSTTTKLRVVFNASSPTTTGVSLNDLQMVGPTIQSDLLSILLRFRHYSYVMTGDIEKMYRQALIRDEQRHLQRIIWRDNPSDELQIFQLNTITYGTASAPFLAVRCLKQLAIECEDSLISQIISEDFYVDDLNTGCQSVEQLIKIRDDVCKVLSAGCFNLRKIESNVKNFTPSDDNPYVPLNLGQENSIKTLGLGWCPSMDELCFTLNPTINSNPTKRSVLSTIGQIFDPLGLLCVFIIQAKIILQKLWLLKTSWDEPLPAEIKQIWHKFTSELKYLATVRIPRCITCKDPRMIEIHTFCDSSQDAYGACVFVRSITDTNEVQTHLLCAKSKVAPLKPVTIPRLELCGALTAARLTRKVLQAFRLPIQQCFLWTDSSIVLGWLKTEPNKLKLFVKNRVAEIQELTQSFEWRHVPTHSNPADLLTRGVNVSELHNLNLWWNGPSFLLQSPEFWPQSNFNHHTEVLPEVASCLVTQNNVNLIDFSRFSNLQRMIRSIAYVLRFLHNYVQDINNKIHGPLGSNELEKAFTLLLRQSQLQSFNEEYKLLQNKKGLPSKNSLLQLSPFLDDQGLIRVGGRLANSEFNHDMKHPVLISCKHPIAKLIFTQEHTRLFHAAPQLLLSSIRQRFWPLGGRNMARLVAHKCSMCSRMKAQTVSPIMGQLPEQRLSPGYPFQTTGVDYAGPLIAADRRGRGCKHIKVYVAVFVCFTTKAIHLELVTELTKDAYIAALRRFIARRSKPSVMFSDNGTQFVGAKNEIYKFIKENSAHVSESMANDSIDFKFIPAYAPHFGGLWEAGVKSFKYHLVRVLGNSYLTFEELYTTLVQIESILNSRPLTPISPDPWDLTPLTPGHFLVGRALTSLPSPRLDDVNLTRLQRWDRVEALRQHFWSRWHKEYVSELQQKTKWRCSKRGSLQKGAMVLIKEEALPPMKWCLGRIQDVHYGVDGVGRVADILTSKGVIRRAFNKICPLPTTEEDDGNHGVISSVESHAFNAGGHVEN